MFRIVLVYTLLSLPNLALAQTDTSRFDIYIPINEANEKVNHRRDQVADAAEFARALESYRQNSHASAQLLRVYLYLPASFKEPMTKDQLIGDLERQVKEVLPNQKVSIITRFLASDAPTPQWPAIEGKRDLALPENEGGIEQVFASWIAVPDITSSSARTVKRSMAGIRLLAIMVTRSAQLGAALSLGGTPAVAAGTLIVGEALLEGFTIRYIREIQEKYAQVSRKLLAPVFKNAARSVGVPILNLATFSIGWPLAMQSLTHFANSNIPLPNVKDASSVVGGMTFDTLLYVWIFTFGYEKLRDKGWLTNAQIDVLLQAMGTIYFVNGMINSNPNWYHLRAFTWLPTWTIYGIVGVLGHALPVRRNRIVLIESSLRDLNLIWDEQFIRQENCDSALRATGAD